MNTRMVFGLLWMAFAGLISYMPDLPSWSTAVLVGNLLIGLSAFLWGMAGKGYFQKDKDVA